MKNNQLIIQSILKFLSVLNLKFIHYPSKDNPTIRNELLYPHEEPGTTQPIFPARLVVQRIRVYLLHDFVLILRPEGLL